MISFASVNGPSTTDVPPSAANTTLAPAELGLSPSPTSMIPAFTSCSLYAFMTANISSFGAILPSSAPSPLIMTRTFMTYSFVVDAVPTVVPGSGPHHYVERAGRVFDIGRRRVSGRAQQRPDPRLPTADPGVAGAASDHGSGHSCTTAGPWYVGVT